MTYLSLDTSHIVVVGEGESAGHVDIVLFSTLKNGEGNMG